MTKLPVPFDNPYTYPGHSGVDFPQPLGTIFRASGPGVVTWLGRNDRGGNFIWVKYDAIGPKVGYHHMDSHEGCPDEGTRFGYADQLGFVGNSGNSTGPHLHSEVEGYGTTDGYWQFFNPDVVVGHSGGGSSPISPLSEEDEMLIIKSTGAVPRLGIKKGFSFVNPLDGPLVLLSADEVGALEYWKERGIPYRLAEWPAKTVDAAISVRGMRPFNASSGRADYSKVVY